MSKEEILERAIQKAIDGGYIPDGIENVSSFKPTIRNGQAWVRWFNDDGREVIQDLEHVIFNHDFAKSLFGETQQTDKLWQKLDKPTDNGREYLLNVKPAWQYHLQMMVVSDDPIAYLGANI